MYSRTGILQRNQLKKTASFSFVSPPQVFFLLSRPSAPTPSLSLSHSSVLFSSHFPSHSSTLSSLVSVCRSSSTPLLAAGDGAGPVDSALYVCVCVCRGEGGAFIGAVCRALPEANGIQMWLCAQVTAAIYGKKTRDGDCRHLPEPDFDARIRPECCSTSTLKQAWNVFFFFL